MQIGSQTHFHTEKIQMLVQGIVQGWVAVFFNTFFRLEIHGADQALAAVRAARKADKGMLFACNHASEWDAILVRCALPWAAFTNPMYYVAMTREHYQYERFGWRRYFYGGTFFRMLGAFPAYLGMRDYQASLVNHIELLEHARPVCIFPEGKISVNTLKPTEAKGGIAFLAEQTGTDIIPVRCSGLGQVTWRNILLLRRPTITVTYKPMLLIKDLVAKAHAEGFAGGPDLYKHMAADIMTEVRAA